MPRARGLGRRWFVALIAAVGLAQVAVEAHPVPFSYLDVRMTPAGVDGALVVHILDVAHDLGIEPADRLLDPAYATARAADVQKLLGARLGFVIDDAGAALVEWGRVEVLPERASLRLPFTLRPNATASIRITAILFPYDANHRTFVNVYEHDEVTQAVLAPSRPSFEYFAGTRQGAWAVVGKFLPSGLRHILIGADHLLFLIGLLLAGGSLRRLVLIVTGFTLAHSITLSLAALDLVRPPAWVVEPVIALSIVYVGVDNLLVRQGRDVRPWIALAFGLIHGFGFANVLREMDLPVRALGWSLFSFNVGVEIGQLIVVVLAAAALAAVRRWRPSAERIVLVGGSITVILAGTFWFVERVFFSGVLR